MRDEYRIHVAVTDEFAAHHIAGDKAIEEGLSNTGERHLKHSRHVRNAMHHMVELCPDGYRLEAEFVISIVPDVNPAAIDPTPRFTNLADLTDRED